MPNKNTHNIIVIGAGPGGMMAAGRAAELGAKVRLFEKNSHPGKKLLLTGNTRCNLTNTMPLNKFIAMYGNNGNFLRNAFHRFFREELLDFLRRYGVETLAEHDGRIFPATSDSRDVVAALKSYMLEYGVSVHYGSSVSKILTHNGAVTGVESEDGDIPGSAVILATGGASYRETGSSGDGYKMAGAIGHSIIPLRPALVPLVVREIHLAKAMQGVSLAGVRMTAFNGVAEDVRPEMIPKKDFCRGMGKRSGNIVESRTGDMLFTHFGLGGPLTLLLSLAVIDALTGGPVCVAIDLMPHRDAKTLGIELRNAFQKQGARQAQKVIENVLPKKMARPFLEVCGIPYDKLCAQISAEDIAGIVRALKCLSFNVKEPLSLDRAIVTAGGVSLDEINPVTMESKIVKGLYLCGEVMNIDADTGGYNLQAAFSTGFVAGGSAAEQTR